MRAAMRIGEWSLAHALDILIGPDPEMTRALAWMERRGKAEISTSDLRRAFHLVASDARPLANRLERIGVLRALDPPESTSKAAGRRARATPSIPAGDQRREPRNVPV